MLISGVALLVVEAASAQALLAHLVTLPLLARGYRVFRSFVLPDSASLHGGVLRLSQDARITAAMRDER